MIGVSMALMLAQAASIDPRSVNPTIPYSQCMLAGLSGRLRGRQSLPSGERIAIFEKSRGECAEVRAAALAGVDAMLAKMYQGKATPNGLSGLKMMDVWDQALRRTALDPGFNWDDLSGAAK